MFYSPYHINKVIVNRNGISTIYFECGQQNCKARAILKFYEFLDDRVVIKKKNNHSCSTSSITLKRIDLIPINEIKRILSSHSKETQVNSSESSSK